VDPHLLAAIVSGGLALASGAGALRRQAVVRAIEARRRAFVVGLPTFERGPAQLGLVASMARFESTRDALEALAEAASYVDLPRLPAASRDAEAALTALATTFVHDARVSLALALGTKEGRELIASDPGVFRALHERGADVLASRASVAALCGRIAERTAASVARLDRLGGAARFEPGSVEDRVTTMAHASALGALGAKVGAAVGTLVLPGVGTALGTALGGLTAGVGGATVARELEKSERRAHAEARARLERALETAVPASASRALSQIHEVDLAERRRLTDAREAACAKRVRPNELRALTNDLLRALSWRLDEGEALLASEGLLLGPRGEGAWTRAVKAREETLAREALASKKRSHARATEALKSALKEADALAALGWVVAVPLPSHPEVDALFDTLAAHVTRFVDAEADALAAERRRLVDTWLASVRALDAVLRAELERHAAVREALASGAAPG